ncbi:MAG: serine/threonine protein kinase, partial [Acidobacteriia bacterium]|nr:serine/threonine protein kinase [Terriglobia bacterium]
HRDIKPQNILIDRRDHFFLTDFGIAVTEFAGRGTAEGTSLGTIHYMSPEQIENSRALDPHRGGRRSDVYSFGVVLFEMLTGRLPFGDRHTRDESYRQIVWMHCTAPPPRLGDFNPAVAPTIEAPVLRCLEKDPDQRPQSCGELLMMLDQAAAAAGRERPDHEQTWVENKGAYTPTVHLSSSTSDSATAHPKAVATNPRRSDSGSVVTKGARKPIGRTVWLGLAGLCIVALVGYAVVTGALKKGPTTQVPPKVATADTKPIKPAPPPDKSVPPPVKSAVYKAAPNSTKSNRGNTDAPPVPGAGHLYDQDSGSQRK